MSEEKEILDPQAEQETTQAQAENAQHEANTENDPMTELEIQLAEAKDKHLRLFSEFENFRRRTAKERLELITTANESLMLALLPIVDDFERAQKALGNTEDQAENGIALIYHKLVRTLEGKGLKKMEVGPGTEFNADFHEAITQIPSPSEDLKGKVVDVIENGYYLGDKIIRFARVVVGA
jgi:molecular chaperone GrpE